MAVDYSKLSDAELEAIANNDYSKLSDQTLEAIAKDTGESPKEGPVKPAKDSGLEAAVPGAVSAALTNLGYNSPTGLPQLAKNAYEAAAPVVASGVKNAVEGYAKNPLGAVADAVLLHGGMPPVYGTVKSAQGVSGAYNAAKEIASNFSKSFSSLPETLREPFFEAVDKLKPADYKKFQDLVNTKGPAALNEFKIPEYLSKDPAVMSAFNEVKGAVNPSTMTKIGAVAGPILRGAARVAGPAGLAYTGYDVADRLANQDYTGAGISGAAGAVGAYPMLKAAAPNLMGKVAPYLGTAARIGGVGLAGMTPGTLNAGEDQQMAQMHKVQDTIGKMAPAQQSMYFTLPADKRQQVNQMIMNGQDPSGLLVPNAVNSGFAQQLNRLGR